jgi:transposase
MAKNKRTSKGMPVIHPSAAGIDIGSRFHVAAVPPDLLKQPVKTFQAFTSDLHAMADWLIQAGITTVAMESTGVYWVPVYEILEDRGLEVILANARDARGVPGRKTDVNDSQWLQKLHACGLLKASFRPDRQISALRSYLRQRERYLDYCAAHIQHMQKSLTFMNLQLHHVITDITGVTGMKIIRSIVQGQQNPLILAKHRDGRCKATEKTIAASLTGNYQPEHLFALEQALLLYDFYQLRVHDCDEHINAALKTLNQSTSVPDTPLPKPRHKTRQPNALNFDVRAPLYQLVGSDLTQIHGIGPYLALRLVSECGTDLSRWPSAKHFTSWLTLSPGSKVSGGKVLSSHSRKTNNRITAHLRLAATTVGRTNTALGAFYRRLSARIGKAKAVTATARKMAVLFYNAMRYGMSYQDPGSDHYEQQYRKRVVKGLHRRAAEFGFTLNEIECVS